MLLYNRKINLRKFAIPSVILFALISLSFTTHILYSRYYVFPTSKTASINCDAEHLESNGAFATNIPSIVLENGHTQNNEKARSGVYSAKLTPENQFAFTNRLYNCKEGDQIHIEAWRFGTEGEIVLVGGPGDLYLSKSNPTTKDGDGWECIQLNYTVPAQKHFQEVGIFLFYNGKDSTYFDDLKINYQKKH